MTDPFPADSDDATVPVERRSGSMRHDDQSTRPTGGSIAGERSLFESTAKDLGEGDRIGAYRLERELGRGGQATVFLAVDDRLGREVALKIMTRRGGGPALALDRFVREARLASRLEHPGICPVYDVGEDGDYLYIAMRRIDGDSLASLLGAERSAGRPVHLRRAATILARAARALHAAHEQGIVHRDVKPGNLMIEEGDHPVVLDFGLARGGDEIGPELTLTGDVFGTPAYMSPEQVEGKKLDRRTDVFSLGVILYEAVTGRRPFLAPTAALLYAEILDKEAPAVHRLRPEIDRDLATVVATAIEKNLDRRYSTAEDFARDLERWLAGESVAARPLTTAERVLRWARRHRAAAALLVILVLGVPVVSALVLRVAWTWDDVAQQRALDIAMEVDVLVEEGFRIGRPELGVQVMNDALEKFERAFALDATREDAAVGILFATTYSRGTAAARAELSGRLSRWAGEPGFEFASASSMVALDAARDVESVIAALGDRGAAQWFLVGRTLAVEGYFARDRHLSRRALNCLHIATLASPTPKAAFYVELCSTAWDLKDATMLEAAARALVRLWPERADSWFHWGCALHNSDPVGAKAAYEKAVTMRSDRSGPWINLSHLASRAGDLEEALRCADAAIAIAPDSPEAQLARAGALVDLGRPKEALPAAEKAVRHDPRDARYRTVLLDAWIALGEAERGPALAAEGLELVPEDAAMRNLAGVAAVNVGDLEEAERYFEEAARLDAASAVARINAATLLLRRRRFKAADRWVREVLAIDPRSKQAWGLAAVIALRGGDRSRALEAARCEIESGGGLGAWRRYVGLLEHFGRLDEAWTATREAAAAGCAMAAEDVARHETGAAALAAYLGRDALPAAEITDDADLMDDFRLATSRRDWTRAARCFDELMVRRDDDVLDVAGLETVQLAVELGFSPEVDAAASRRWRDLAIEAADRLLERVGGPTEDRELDLLTSVVLHDDRNRERIARALDSLTVGTDERSAWTALLDEIRELDAP